MRPQADIDAQIAELQELRRNVPETREVGETEKVLVNTHRQVDAAVFALQNNLTEEQALTAFDTDPERTAAAEAVAWKVNPSTDRRTVAEWFRALLVLLLVCLLLPAATGCTRTTLKTASGDQFTRTSFGTKTAISELSMSGDTNGLRSVTMKGYSNDQVEFAAAVTAAAINAAKTAK